MSPPPAQPEAAATLDGGVDAMVTGVSGAAAQNAGAAAPTEAELEGDMLAPEHFTAPDAAPTAASPPAASARAAADALASVAKDLAGASAAKDANRGAAAANAPTAAAAPAAPPVNSVEELDRVLAAIAQGQLGEVQAETVAVASLDAQTDAARVKAALEAGVAVDPAAATPVARANADGATAPTSARGSGASEFTEPEGGGAVEAPDAEGDFEAPAPTSGENASPQAKAAASATASPPAPPAAPQADGPAAPAAQAKGAPAQGAPTQSAHAPPKASKAPAGGKASLLERLLKPLMMLNEPFQGLSPVAMQTVSIIAIITLFNAACLWVFLMLR